MAAQPMSLDQFRAAVLARFRGSPKGVSEAELSAELESDNQALKQFVEVSEYMDQLRMISAKLVQNCPNHDPDLLSLHQELTFEVFLLWQQSIIGLPQAYIETDKAKSQA